MKRKTGALLMCLILVLSAFPVYAGQPEIKWISDPEKGVYVWAYSTEYEYDVSKSDQETLSYSEGLYWIKVLRGDLSYSALSPDGAGDFMYGAVDKNGKWVIKPDYMECHPFSNGYAYVRQQESHKNAQGAVIVTIADHIIDTKGQKLNAYEQLFGNGYHVGYEETVQGGYVSVYRPANSAESRPTLYGITDMSGKFVVPAEFLIARLPNEGMCLVQNSDGYGFYDTAGRPVIATRYEEALSFSEGLAAVKINGRWGFTDKTGVLRIAAEFEDARSFSDGLSAVKKNGLWGFIDTSGKTVIPFVYDDVKDMSEGAAPVKRGDMWGAVDMHGTEVITCSYEEVRQSSDGRMAVKWQGRFGAFDTKGEKIIDFLYRDLKDFKNGVTSVSSDKKSCGVIDRWGNVVLPEKYNAVSAFADGGAVCLQIDKQKNRKLGIIQAPAVSEKDTGKRTFIRLYLDGKLLNIDQSPVIRNDRTMAPMRAVSEALGADVTWDNAAKTASFKTDETEIVLTIGSKTAIVNGEAKILDAAPEIISGRTMVPVRFIAETLNVGVEWDNDARSVKLKTM